MVSPPAAASLPMSAVTALVPFGETRSEPVLDFSEPQPEPSPGFEERLDDFAEKVADIDVNLGEGPETLVENVQTTPMQTPSKKTVSKRKISPKQVPKQGPTKDEPEDPSSKEGSTHHFKNWPNFFREVWCGEKL